MIPKLWTLDLIEEAVADSLMHPAADVDGFRITCYKCNNAWGHCHCPDVADGEGFEFYGMYITNPVVSECGRFFVEPVIYYGEAYTQWLAKKESK